MKQIRLESLTIDNFKGQRHLQLDFGGRSASIYGDNAAGKTTIYDALTWLLFGKDSQGRGDFEIKPLGPDGSVLDHSAITSVEAVFSGIGRKVSLRKEYYEKWSAKRGSVNKTFDGNTCDYYVDGVPCKKYEYEEKAEELLDEKTFRLLTSTSYFCGAMTWQERRACLFRVCGTASDGEIMSTDARFAPLSAALGGLELGDYRKKLQAERRGYNTAREAVPVRLDECKKTVDELRDIDFDTLRAEVAIRAQKRDELSAELLKLDHNALLDAKRNQRQAVQNQITQLDNENTAFRQVQVVPKADDGSGLRRELEEQKKRLQAATADKCKEDGIISDYQRNVEACRASWASINTETFQGQICPTCGQALLGAALEAAEGEFAAHKAERLGAVVHDSKVYKEAIAQAQSRREDAIERAVAAENRIAELTDLLAQIKPADQPEITDKPGYREERLALTQQAADLDIEVGKLSGESRAIRMEIAGKVKALSEEIEAISGTVAKESVLASTMQRMDQLREDARAAAEKMEAIDAQLYLCDEFTRYKAKFTDDSINSKFRLVSFRLFQEQINGGLAECCDPMVGGVPYGSLNNGARINAGLDVISTLSEHYSVAAPLFVDNAESVTALTPVGTQVIRLVVSEADKKLRCEYEN